jgi:oxygen-independent coproporphyrinogen-3 oxidase
LIPRDGAYYPAIYYPPIPKYPPTTPDEVLADFVYDSARPFSAYLHIPFCASRCLYCHWVVNVGSSEDDRDRYLDSLCVEMDLYRRMLGVEHPSPRSVLIGGGTPSMLSPRQTERLLSIFSKKFDLAKCTQITCEVEPTTVLGAVGLEKLRVMKSYGVNRISLGVQSFNDKALRDMGRFHSSSNAVEAIDQIRRAGFDSLSIDLIYGYPGCTVDEWAETLDTAFSHDIDACQLYRLRIVPHGEKVGAITGAFDRMPAAFPSTKDIYVMKELGILAAAQGGLKEVSRRVFAKGPKHNSDYLTDHTDGLRDVFGLGISSWSNLQGRFFVNTGESLEKYHALIETGRLPIAKGQIRSADNEKRWAIAVPLKHHGVSKGRYRRITGEELATSFGRKIEALKKFGLLREDEDSLRLTEKGCFLADEVVIQFYLPEYLPFPKASYADGELNPYLP